jgi:maltose alpha-D-glucosyltransferase / alpha-amylase
LTATPSREEIAAAVARLGPESFAAARWFGGKGRTIRGLVLDEAFPLPGGGDDMGAVFATVGVDFAIGAPERYVIPFRAGPAGLVPAAEGDGTWRALAVAALEGRTIAALPAGDDVAARPSAVLVCRPATARGRLLRESADLAERALGADQSNTSVVLGERLILKAFRRLEAGLAPELELVAYLTEEAGFGAVPALAGFVEVVSARDGAATVAILQEYVPDAADAYETVAEALTAWILAPGAVSVEFATEIAADIGTLTADLHAALAGARGVPELAPREATREELRRWHADATASFERAVDVAPGDAGRLLRKLAPAIAAEFTLYEAVGAVPLLTRIHADYHLGQILIAEDGFRVVDFEGDPTRSLAERRAHHSPLRDVASMLRSLDHVGRSARRRAATRNGGPPESPGLDVDAWIVRARERFLAAYRESLRESGAPIEVDPALVRAFEVEKECTEFVYAATFLPEWLWAPTEGLRALFADAQKR